MTAPRMYSSHGSGRLERAKFAAIGSNVIFEDGVLVFHPENIYLGSNIYIGHYAILKGYYQNRMVIGDNTWIGQGCFLHSAGGLVIGKNVGIGPGVKIITSTHAAEGDAPILFRPLRFAAVTIEDDCDVGLGAIILPGVTIGRGAQVGAGAVVAKSVEPFTVVAGVPAKPVGKREPHR